MSDAARAEKIEGAARALVGSRFGNPAWGIVNVDAALLDALRAALAEPAPRPAEEACPEPEGCDCNEGYGHPMSCGRCHGSGIVGGAGRKASK